MLAALAVAAITAVLGFSLSYAWLMAHLPGHGPRPVDRRSAEGRGPRQAARRNPAAGWGAASSRLSMGSAGYAPTATPTPAEPPNDPKAMEAACQPPDPATTDPRRAVAVAPELPRNAYPSGNAPRRRRARRNAGASELAAAPSQGREFPPLNGSRSPASSLPDAWARSGWTAVAFYLGPERVASGVLLSPDGLVATRAQAAVGPGLRAVVEGASYGVEEVVGYEPTWELAVVRLTGSNFAAPELSPEAVGRGEELAFASGSGNQPQSALVLEDTPGVAEGTFRFQGAVYPTNLGSPLLNSHGEVAALVLGKPFGYPGNNYNLAVDSAGLWSVLRQAQAGTLPRRPPDDVLGRALCGLMLQTMAPAPREAASGRSNARVVPGSALGNYHIGMNLDELEREFGVMAAPPSPDGVSVLRAAPYPLEFTLVEGRVVAIATTDPFYATARGVGVGTRLATMPDDPSFDPSVTGYGPAGRRLLVGQGVELGLNPRGEGDRLVVVSEPLEQEAP